MNPNFMKNSNLIRMSLEAKKRAIRRLVGSAFLLFVSLILLLNVTTKMKPLSINPSVIEIKNNNPIASATISSNSTHLNASAAVIAKPQTSAPITVAAINNVKIESKPLHNTEKEIKPSNFPQAKVISLNKPKQPQDILNGVEANNHEKQYFIQLLTTSDKTKITHLKQELKSKGINSTILIVKAPKHLIYRLEVGPFDDATTASDKFSELKDEGTI